MGGFGNAADRHRFDPDPFGEDGARGTADHRLPDGATALAMIRQAVEDDTLGFCATDECVVPDNTGIGGKVNG